MKNILDRLKKERVKTYQTISLNLSSSRNDVEFNITGSYVYVLQATAGHDIRIKFNEITNDEISLQSFRSIETPFYRFYITHSGLPGGTCLLAIGVETGEFNIEDYLSKFEEAVLQASQTPIIYNVTCAVAGTEYSRIISNNTKKFTIKPRGGALQICFSSGESGTNYIFLEDGQAWCEDNVLLHGKTFYFRSPVAGTVAEFVFWV